MSTHLKLPSVDFVLLVEVGKKGLGVMCSNIGNENFSIKQRQIGTRYVQNCIRGCTADATSVI